MYKIIVRACCFAKHVHQIVLILKGQILMLGVSASHTSAGGLCDALRAALFEAVEMMVCCRLDRRDIRLTKRLDKPSVLDTLGIRTGQFLAGQMLTCRILTS